MYNEELKLKFINELDGKSPSIIRATRLFNLSEPFEINWGRDICTIPESELGEALEAMTSARLGTQSVDMSILRKYARWCMMNEVDGACDGLMKMQDIGYEKLRSTMVDSPEQLQRYLDVAFSPVTDCRQDNLCRGLYWMAFMGFDEETASKISTEHVDLKNAFIRYDDRYYPIYDDAITVIRFLCSANSFICDYVRYESVVERASGTQLLRGTHAGSGVNTKSIERMATRRIFDANKSSDSKISLRYKSIFYSGIFYRMYQDERAGCLKNPDIYLKSYFQNLDDLHQRRVARKSVELATDYQRWKTAFNKQIL